MLIIWNHVFGQPFSFLGVFNEYTTKLIIEVIFNQNLSRELLVSILNKFFFKEIKIGMRNSNVRSFNVGCENIEVLY